MKNEIRHFTIPSIVLACLFYSAWLSAQIMGADISYRFNSTGRYEINLSIFQNCDAAVSLPDSFPIQFSAPSQQANGTLFVYRQLGDEILRPGCQRQAAQTRCEGGNGVGVRITRYINNRGGVAGFAIVPATDWRFTWTNGAIQVSATLNNTSVNFTSPAFRQTATEMPHFVCSGEYRILPLRIIGNGVGGSFSLFIDKNLPAFFGQTIPNNGATAGSAVDNISNLAVQPTGAGSGEILYRMVFPNGSIQRSIILQSLNCNNVQPTISGFDNTTNYTKITCAGQDIVFRLRGTNGNNDPVRLFYDANYRPENDNNFDNNIPGVQVEGQSTNELTFRWTVRGGNRSFFVAVGDDACPLPSVTRYIRYEFVIRDSLTTSVGNDTVGVSCSAPLVISSSTEGGTPPYTYQWTSPQFVNPTTGNPQILSTNASLTRTGQTQLGKNGKGVFSLTVTDANGCVAADSLSVESEFQPKLAPFDSVCTSTTRSFTTVIKDNSTITEPGSIVSRNLTLQTQSGTITSSGTSIAHSYPLGSEGKYLVTLNIVANSSFGGTCSDILTDTVVITRLPIQTLIDTAGRCQLSDIVFTLKDSFPENFPDDKKSIITRRIWQWGEFSYSQNRLLEDEAEGNTFSHAFKGEILMPDSTITLTHNDTTYKVRVQSIDPSGCSRWDSIMVNVRSKPFPTIYHTKSRNFNTGLVCDTCDYFFRCNDPNDRLSWQYAGGTYPFQSIYWANTMRDGRYFREDLTLPDERKFEPSIFQRFGFDSIYSLNEAGEYTLTVKDANGCEGTDKLVVYYPNVTDFNFDENSPFCGLEPANSVIRVNAITTEREGRTYPYWRLSNHVWHWDFTRNRADRDSIPYVDMSSNLASHSYSDTTKYKEGYYTVALRSIDTTGCPDWVGKTFMRTFPRAEGIFIDYLSKGLNPNPFDSVCPNTPIPFTGPTFITPDANQRPIYSWVFCHQPLGQCDSFTTRQPDITRTFADSNIHQVSLQVFYNFKLNESGKVRLNAPQCTTRVYVDSAYVFPSLNPIVFYDGQSEPTTSTRGRCVGEPLTLYGTTNNYPNVFPTKWMWDIFYNNNEGVSRDTVLLKRDTTYSTLSKDSLQTVVPLSSISAGYGSTLVQLTPDNSFFASLNIQDNKGCFHRVTQQISQEPISKPKISVVGTCADEPFSFRIEPSSNEFNNFLRTELRSTRGLLPTNNTPFGQTYQHTYTFGTTDTVIWRVTGVRCSKSDTAIVKVNPRPIARYVADTVCNGSPTTFNATISVATGAPIAQYLWIFDSATQRTGAITTQLYTYNNTAQNRLDTMRVRLVVTDTLGCKDSITQNVAVNPGVVAGVANLDSLKSRAGQPITFTNLSSRNAVGYVLDYGDGFTDSISGYRNSFTHTYVNPGIYTFTQQAINAFGCRATASTEVNLNVYVILPTIFNPASSDICNREIRPSGRGIKRINSFLVYNRWGEKLYETRGELDGNMSVLGCANGEQNTLFLPEGWDGTYKGQEQPMGVYLYYISAETVYGEQIAQQGEIRLIR